MLKILILSVVAVIHFGCASEPEKINLLHVQEAASFADEKSVFYSNDSLTKFDISKMLDAKIFIPKKVKIAVIRLEAAPESSDYLHYRVSKDLKKFAEFDSAAFLVESLGEKIGLQKREITAEFVPQALIPSRADMKALRNLGAAMRAELALVVDSRNDKFKENQVIKNNVAMSVSSADTYLLDTRTGVILKTNTYTKETFAEKMNSDFDLYQTLARARAAGEKRIYQKLAADIRDFVDSAR